MEKEGVPQHQSICANKLIACSKLFLSSNALKHPVVRNASGDKAGVAHSQILPLVQLLLVRSGHVQAQLVSGLLFEEPHRMHCSETHVAHE